MKPKVTLRHFFAIAGSSLLAVTSASAQVSGNWNSNFTGNWSDATKWSSNPSIPGGAGSIVGINSDITVNNLAVTIDTTSRTVGSLTIGDSNNSHSFLLNASGGASLIFDNNGSGATLTETGSVADTISAPITLADNLGVNVAGSLVLSGDISETGGARSLTKTGAGGLTLSGSNSYTGTTTGFGMSFAPSGSNTQTIGNIVTPQQVSDSFITFDATSTGNTAGDFTHTGTNVGGTRTTIFKTGAGTWTLGNMTGFGTLRTILNPRDGILSVGQIVSSVDLRMYSAATLQLRTAGNQAVGILNSISSNLGGLTGTFDNSSGGLITFNLNPLIAFNGAFTLTGSSLDMGTGTVALRATRQVTVSNAASTLTFGGVISGVNFGLTKLGAGTMALSNANTYSGATTVSGGTLLVNNTTGSGTGTNTVDVGASGTLGGSGTISGAVNVTGQISAGNSIETLGTGALALLNGSTLVHELDSSVAKSVGSDLLKVTGNLDLTGTVVLSLNDLALTDTAFAVNDIFSLINYTGTWNNGLFTFSGNALADEQVFTFGLNTWRISYNDATGGLNYIGEYAGGADSFVNLTAVTIIPEPRAALLGGLGLLMLLRRRRH